VKQLFTLRATAKFHSREIQSETVMVIQLFDKGIYVFGTGAARGGDILYNEFNLNPPSDVQKFIDEGEMYMNYSIEKLVEAPADFIFVATGPSNETACVKSGCWKLSSFSEVQRDGYRWQEIDLIQNAD
jgi:ABC-type Fe3+-hydroxamate transport system substrate-binding protein